MELSSNQPPQFSFNTIKNFDTHILKSIPNYDVLLEMVQSISEYFITKEGTIYDLGCSTGKLLKSLYCDNLKIGYDNSTNLLPDEIYFRVVDLNKEFEIKNACLVYSIFTMQFLEKNSRQNYVDTVFNGLNDGGAFILCEKIYQESGFLQEVLTFSHYDYKSEHFTESEMLKKERDLRFIMKPNTLGDNIRLLQRSGFREINTFWQSFNFVGLIAIK